LPPQCPGEHRGVGAPPSAKEEIDTALRSTRVAISKRAIFFIGRILRGIETSGNTIFFLQDEIRNVRKTLGVKPVLVGIPTKRIVRLNASNSRFEDGSAVGSAFFPDLGEGGRRD
jgi:hypothetical protein